MYASLKLRWKSNGNVRRTEVYTWEKLDYFLKKKSSNS